MIRVRLQRDGTVEQILPDGTTAPLEDHTDYAVLNALTEAAIEANARDDADNPPLSDQELSSMRRVPNPRAIRKMLNLTQEQFAFQFQVPLGTLRDWEQGSRQPDAAARTLLRVIEKIPAAVIDALAS